MRSLSTAASGMMAQQTNVETISNNIANLSTTGFKRQQAQFQDLLYQDQRRVGAQSSDAGTIVPAGIQIGLGVRTASILRITEQGGFTQTGSTTDLAIQGKGYFQVQLPSGETAYTRDGSFNLSPTGQLVTKDGFNVLPTLTIPAAATSIAISSSGQVQATIPGQTTPSVVGQISLATFQNEAGLTALGQNLFQVTAASGQATVAVAGSTGVGTVLQGYTEGSNVNPVTEITNLIQAQRAYEMNSKVISASDQMLQTASQLR
jgi:flagellar basal-body rod protein FlgG